MVASFRGPWRGSARRCRAGLPRWSCRRSGALGQLDRGRDGCAGADAHEHAKVGRELLLGRDGIVGGHGHDLVHHGRVVGLGDEARANALDLVAACRLARQDLGLGRLDGDALDGGLLLLQELGRAGDGAAGADARDHKVDGALGVTPDLGAGGLVVGARVRGVHELARDDGARRLGVQLVGLGDGALHALGAGGEHDLRAVGRGELAALHGHGLGHHEDHLVAARGGEHGKANAGVAARGLDHGAAGLEGAVLLGRVEHGLGDAVLYGAAGVGGLVLAQDRGLAVRKGGQVDERGGADEPLGLSCVLHGSISSCKDWWRGKQRLVRGNSLGQDGGT